MRGPEYGTGDAEGPLSFLIYCNDEDVKNNALDTKEKEEYTRTSTRAERICGEHKHLLVASIFLSIKRRYFDEASFLFTDA